MSKITSTEKGKIFIFSNWKISELSEFKYDLFWNSRSMAEMEPEVVLNYLSFANRQAKYAYLHNVKKGMPLKTNTKSVGVLRKTDFSHYAQGLRDFSMLDLSDAILLPFVTSKISNKFTFWKRNSFDS